MVTLDINTGTESLTWATLYLCVSFLCSLYHTCNLYAPWRKNSCITRSLPVSLCNHFSSCSVSMILSLQNHEMLDVAFYCAILFPQYEGQEQQVQIRLSNQWPGCSFQEFSFWVIFSCLCSESITVSSAITTAMLSEAAKWIEKNTGPAVEFPVQSNSLWHGVVCRGVRKIHT